MQNGPDEKVDCLSDRDPAAAQEPVVRCSFHGDPDGSIDEYHRGERPSRLSSKLPSQRTLPARSRTFFCLPRRINAFNPASTTARLVLSPETRRAFCKSSSSISMLVRIGCRVCMIGVWGTHSHSKRFLHGVTPLRPWRQARAIGSARSPASNPCGTWVKLQVPCPSGRSNTQTRSNRSSGQCCGTF